VQTKHSNTFSYSITGIPHGRRIAASNQGTLMLPKDFINLATVTAASNPIAILLPFSTELAWINLEFANLHSRDEFHVF
jgi:hypothetical protein